MVMREMEVKKVMGGAECDAMIEEDEGIVGDVVKRVRLLIGDG